MQTWRLHTPAPTPGCLVDCAGRKPWWEAKCAVWVTRIVHARATKLHYFATSLGLHQLYTAPVVYLWFVCTGNLRCLHWKQSDERGTYRGADKSLARPGKKQTRKHVRDAGYFDIEKLAVIKFIFLYGKTQKEIHAILTETLVCFLPGRAKDLSATYTQQWYTSHRFPDNLRASFFSQAISKPVWHVPLLCVQWKTPVDGQRNCPRYLEFHSKNKFEKLVHLVGFTWDADKFLARPGR